MKTIVIGAGSDLGVHIDGAHLGPIQLLNDVKTFYKGDSLSFMQDNTILKSRDLADRRKNLYEVNRLNEKMYEAILEKVKLGYFPVLLGGDHTVAIPSSLADAKVHEDVGMIWIDAHTDYNNFDTTVSGNMHGLPCAAINGDNKCLDLTRFYKGEYIPASRTVIVGARSIDEWEKDNVKYSGVTVFTTDDIEKQGVQAIMKKAFDIAGYRTKGIHISYDLDVIDPDVAPGVSIPEFDGITEDQAMEITDELVKNMDKITSFDLVEFNPLRDVNRKTEQIAVNILAKIIPGIEKKA